MASIHFYAVNLLIHWFAWVWNHGFLFFNGLKGSDCPRFGGGRAFQLAAGRALGWCSLLLRAPPPLRLASWASWGDGLFWLLRCDHTSGAGVGVGEPPGRIFAEGRDTPK